MYVKIHQLRIPRSSSLLNRSLRTEKTNLPIKGIEVPYWPACEEKKEISTEDPGAGERSKSALRSFCL